MKKSIALFAFLVVSVNQVVADVDNFAKATLPPLTIALPTLQFTLAPFPIRTKSPTFGFVTKPPSPKGTNPPTIRQTLTPYSKKPTTAPTASPRETTWPTNTEYSGVCSIGTYIDQNECEAAVEDEGCYDPLGQEAINVFFYCPKQCKKFCLPSTPADCKNVLSSATCAGLFDPIDNEEDRKSLCSGTSNDFGGLVVGYMCQAHCPEFCGTLVGQQSGGSQCIDLDVNCAQALANEGDRPSTLGLRVFADAADVEVTCDSRLLPTSQLAPKFVHQVCPKSCNKCPPPTVLDGEENTAKNGTETGTSSTAVVAFPAVFAALVTGLKLAKQ